MTELKPPPKPYPKRTMSSSQLQLNKALSNVSPAEIAQAKQILEVEKQKVILESASLAPPPARPSMTDVDLEGLRKTGEIAVQFTQGLDNISDVLLVLVLKFGRATNMMRAMLVGLAVALLVLISCVVLILDQKNENHALLNEMLAIKLQQERMVHSVMEAKTKVDSAAQEAAEAREAAPKVVLDEAGKAKLLVSGDDELKKRVEDQPAPKATYKKTDPPKVTSKGVEIDLGLP